MIGPGGGADAPSERSCNWPAAWEGWAAGLFGIATG